MYNKLQITRYNKTRNWGSWENNELLAVTVYRKGTLPFSIISTTSLSLILQYMTMDKTKSAAITSADFSSSL